MKRVLYICLAVGLAIGFSGCGDGGGGYWPANPAAQQPSVEQQTGILGGNNAANVCAGLFAPTSANTLPQDYLQTSTSITNGCPMLPSLPSLGSSFDPVAGSVLGASRSRTKTRSQASSGNISSISDVMSATEYPNYYKFVYEYKPSFPMSISTSILDSSCESCGNYSMVQYSWKYTWYVRYVDVNGSEIPLSSDATNWFTCSSNPEKIWAFGTWDFTISGDNYNWSSTTKFGDYAHPWKYENLTTANSSNPYKVSGKTSTTASGNYGGYAVSGFTYSTEMSGADGWFKFPYGGGYPTGFITSGNTALMVTITFDASNKAIVTYSPTAPANGVTTITMGQ